MADPAGRPGPERLDDAAVEQRVARVEELLGNLEHIPGRTAELALEAVETLVEVYGEALARVVAAAREDSGVLSALTSDELVRHLLLLHRVHPDPVPARVERAVADAGPALRSAGASADVLELVDGVARVELSAHGCGGGAGALQDQIRDAVLAAAPEVAAVEFVDPPRAPALIPVEALLRKPAAAATTRAPFPAAARG